MVKFSKNSETAKQQRTRTKKKDGRRRREQQEEQRRRRRANAREAPTSTRRGEKQQARLALFRVIFRGELSRHEQRFSGIVVVVVENRARRRREEGNVGSDEEIGRVRVRLDPPRGRATRASDGNHEERERVFRGVRGDERVSEPVLV